MEKGRDSTEYTPDALSQKAAALRQFADQVETLAARLREMGVKSIGIRHEKTLQRGVGYVLNWISEAQRSVNEKAFGDVDAIVAEATRIGEAAAKKRQSKSKASESKRTGT